MEYDIKKITEWTSPPENDARLLTMPTIPLPLFNRNPRLIMGQTAWNKVRKREYMRQNYTCQASKKSLGHGNCHLHECYDIDFENCTSKFNRYIVIDPLLHTTFIHSGRALTLYQKGDPQSPETKMLRGLELGFSLVKAWNQVHPDEDPLRVSSVFLDWAKDSSIGQAVKQLIESYKIKFYEYDLSCFNKKNWSRWKLIFNGKEYPSKWQTQEEWNEEFGTRPKKDIWEEIDNIF